LELMLRTFAVGLLIAAGVFWLHFYEQSAGGDLDAIRTTAVNAIVIAEAAYLFSCRSLRQTLLRIGFFGNPWVLTGVLAMLAAQLLFTYLPVMNRLFGSAPISWEAWMRIGGVAVATFVLVEMEKIVRTRWTQRRRSRA
jgi:cation-transporting ATPase F